MAARDNRRTFLGGRENVAVTQYTLVLNYKPERSHPGFTVLIWSHTYDPRFKSVDSSQKDKAAEKARMLLKVLNNLQHIEPERRGDERKGI